MKKHTKIYYKYFGLDECDLALCEWCGWVVACDIHHIKPRGMGGKNKKADVITNLMALCRYCHQLAESKKISKEELQKKHMEKINRTKEYQQKLKSLNQ